MFSSDADCAPRKLFNIFGCTGFLGFFMGFLSLSLSRCPLRQLSTL